MSQSLILNTAPEAFDFAGHVVQSLMDNGVLIDDDGVARLLTILRDELEGRELGIGLIREVIARRAAERLFRVTPGTSTPSVENATLKFQGAIDAVATATLESLADLAADELVDAALRNLTTAQAQIVKTASQALATLPERKPTTGDLAIVEFHPTAAASVRLVFEEDTTTVRIIVGYRSTNDGFYSDGTEVTFNNAPAPVIEATIIALTK